MGELIAIRKRRLAWLGPALVAGALWSGAALAQGPSGSISSDVGYVAAYVDIAYCASGPVQCTSTGHTAQAAAADNHNPVRIVVQVSGNTGDGFFAPVNGLASSAFGVSTQFVPTGGVVVERLICATCFQAVAGGTYALYVHPRSSFPVGPNVWHSGSYFVQIGFPSAGKTFFPVIARIDIP